MHKGDSTRHGIFLGEVSFEREKRLTPDELAEVTQIYGDRAPDDTGKLTDTGIGLLFDCDGDQVVVPLEIYKR